MLTFSLSANSPTLCTSLLSLDLIEPLLQLLPLSNVVSVLVCIWVTSLRLAGQSVNKNSPEPSEQLTESWQVVWYISEADQFR